MRGSHGKRLPAAPFGHTLVELLVVVMIMSILAVGGRSLIAGKSEFAPSLIKDQLISSLRLAQQNALSRRSGTNVSHTISQSGGEFFFTVAQNGQSMIRSIDDSGLSITWSTTTLTGTCAMVTGSLPHPLSFDADGEAESTRYCISGDTEYSVCLSSLGFAYEGICDT